MSYNILQESSVSLRPGQKRRAGSPISPAELQFVTLRVADEWAQKQEKMLGGATDFEKFVKTYIAFLISNAAKMDLISNAAKTDAVYTTAAICLILYSFTAKQAVKIYEQIIPDNSDDDYKDDTQFSSAKRELIDKIRRRFYGLISFTEHAQGKKYYYDIINPNDAIYDLVIKCLESFIIWDTECIPENFNDSNGRGFFSLASRKSHAVIHPACFNRLLNPRTSSSLMKLVKIPVIKTYNNQSEIIQL